MSNFVDKLWSFIKWKNKIYFVPIKYFWYNENYLYYWNNNYMKISRYPFLFLSVWNYHFWLSTHELEMNSLFAKKVIGLPFLDWHWCEHKYNLTLLPKSFEKNEAKIFYCQIIFETTISSRSRPIKDTFLWRQNIFNGLKLKSHKSLYGQGKLTICLRWTCVKYKNRIQSRPSLNLVSKYY